MSSSPAHWLPHSRSPGWSRGIETVVNHSGRHGFEHDLRIEQFTRVLREDATFHRWHYERSSARYPERAVDTPSRKYPPVRGEPEAGSASGPCSIPVCEPQGFPPEHYPSQPVGTSRSGFETYRRGGSSILAASDVRWTMPEGGPPGGAIDDLQRRLVGFQNQVRAAARRSWFFSWYCWGFLFAGVLGFGLAAALMNWFPVVTTTQT